MEVLMKRKRTMPKKNHEKKVEKAVDPLDEIRAFVHEQQQLQKAQESAQKRVEQAEKELDTARHELAEAEAQRLMDNPEALDGETSPQSAEFVQASLKLEEARAALGGVTRRLRERDLDILSVSEKLQAYREDYNRAEIARFLTDAYEPTAAALAVMLRRADALASALGVRIEETHRLPERGDWTEDAQATALYQEHSGPKALSESLGEFRREAELRVMVQERNRTSKAGFDPTARYRVIRPFRCYGKEFLPGEIVDCNSIDLKLLGELYQANRFKMIEPKEEWTV
jgi:hypothetical protein